MLPVFGRPSTQYFGEEARDSRIKHIVFVTGRNKSAIKGYFDWACQINSIL